MSNHLHLLFIAKDAEQAVQFYSELMKKITDYYKKLLSLPRLELWEPNGAVLSEILDLESAKDRIAYLFANPSRANLVDSINDYPGFSSYESFKTDTSCTETVPWVRQPSIRPLPHPTLTERQDRFLTNKLCSRTKLSHPLTVEPRAAFTAFGVREELDLVKIQNSIKQEIERREECYRSARVENGTKILGANALRKESIRKAHTPKRTAADRKILFHTTMKDLAMEFLARFDVFCARCRDAYEDYKRGNQNAQWPPGAFRPPMGPLANALA